MEKNPFQRTEKIDISWCPGCGNFAIKASLSNALSKLKLNPQNVAIVSGIGQAGKMPHYITVNGFHTLHGRAIPAATAVKTTNPELTVIAEGGDGDMYAEGGNHLIHAIRRNPNITVLIHNNQIYGLTKGQASPTTLVSTKTPTQPWGVFEEPLNSIALAISLNASFVARTFSGNIEKTEEIIIEAINHKGLSIVDIFHPCPSFNKVNTLQWYKEHTYYLEGHDVTDRKKAFEKSLETDKYPLGIFYTCEKPVFEDVVPPYISEKTPIWKREPNLEKIEEIMNSKRT